MEEGWTSLSDVFSISVKDNKSVITVQFLFFLRPILSWRCLFVELGTLSHGNSLHKVCQIQTIICRVRFSARLYICDMCAVCACVHACVRECAKVL